MEEILLKFFLAGLATWVVEFICVKILKVLYLFVKMLFRIIIWSVSLYIIAFVLIEGLGLNI